jgi:D-hydroxyproline dehydrogenase subunit alpha
MTRCDVLVIGAGPAGMAAAVSAAEAGRRVIVIDDNSAPGGQIWRGYAESAATNQPHSATYAKWARRLKAARIDVLSATRVIDQPSQNEIRVESESGSADLAYDRLILATGARERFLPFPGWTLPGVMGAGGLQAMVKAGLPIEGKRVVLAGSGPLLLAVAANLARHGARVAGIFEQAPLTRLLRIAAGLVTQPAKLLEGARYRWQTLSAVYRTGSWVTQAHGEDRLRYVTVRIGDTTRKIACDYLGSGFHLVPNLELPRLLGCAIQEGYVRTDRAQQSSVKNVYCAGELTGIGGLEKALIEGEIAGLAAAGSSTAHLASRRTRVLGFACNLDRAFALRAELRNLPDAETIVCRCEDVRYSTLEGMRNGRAAKLQTRCGMGPCQARICAPATNFLFGWESESVRPPILPAAMHALAAECEPAAPKES